MCWIRPTQTAIQTKVKNHVNLELTIFLIIYTGFVEWYRREG